MSYGFGKLNDYAHECHEIARAHGFWDEREPGDVKSDLAALMLVTTEVAEAAEAVRVLDRPNLEEELADICIRVFDFAAGSGMNLEQAIVNKMRKNRERPHMHGKKA